MSDAITEELRKRREARSEKLKRQKASNHWPHADLTNVELIIKANECDEVSGHTEEEIRLVLKELERRVRDLSKERERLKELLKLERPQTVKPPQPPLKTIEGGKR